MMLKPKAKGKKDWLDEEPKHEMGKMVGRTFWWFLTDENNPHEAMTNRQLLKEALPILEKLEFEYRKKAWVQEAGALKEAVVYLKERIKE